MDVAKQAILVLMYLLERAEYSLTLLYCQLLRRCKKSFVPDHYRLGLYAV
jgi:hypothetical protein